MDEASHRHQHPIDFFQQLNVMLLLASNLNKAAHRQWILTITYLFGIA